MLSRRVDNRHESILSDNKFESRSLPLLEPLKTDRRTESTNSRLQTSSGTQLTNPLTTILKTLTLNYLALNLLYIISLRL